MVIDTHAHLHDDKLIDLDAVVSRYLANGVEKVINMGCCLKTSEIGRDLSEKYSSVYFAAGYHPSDANDFNNENLDKIKALLLDEKCVAVGEIGLDYYWQPFDKDKQIDCFITQLEVAKEFKLPVSIHSREATGDMMKILKEHKNLLEYSGVMHCFSGSVETAKELLDLGLYISFAGPLTFKNSVKAKEVAKYVPLDRCLTETDCPYLAPHPLRGTVNEPKNVVITTEFLADIKEMPMQDFSKIVYDNAIRLFYKLAK